MSDTTDYKQIAYKLQGDIDDKIWEKNQIDLDFLKEIRDKLTSGMDKLDFTLIEFAMQMINDWIDELEEKQK